MNIRRSLEQCRSRDHGSHHIDTDMILERHLLVACQHIREADDYVERRKYIIEIMQNRMMITGFVKIEGQRPEQIHYRDDFERQHRDGHNEIEVSLLL